jgi:prephenate dehydrogenase
MPPKRLSILGVGLLGGSLALAAKKLIKGCEIFGYAHRPETLEAARKSGMLDQGFDRPEPAVDGADLVVLCTPVSLLSPLLQRISGSLANGAIVTDVGSTKRSVVEAGERLLQGERYFVGSHPMAGSEKRGLHFASADLFLGATCILTPTERTHAPALQKVDEFWRILGMNTTRLSPAEHDQLLSDISHLPHAVAAALVAMQLDRAMALSGKGFQDLTRIAAGDGALWRDILLDNRDSVRQSIHGLRKELQRLENMLENTSSDELRQWLDRAAGRRRSMADQQGNG